MKLFLLLDNAPCPVLAPHTPVVVAVWNKGNVPGGQLSMPAELAARLLPIREELNAWVYTMGKTVVGKGNGYGETLEETLRCGDELSMWWCSTLAEKHPKVTHNLFAALKLRALEQVIDENTITHVRLLSNDRVLTQVLERFCAKTGRVFSHEPPSTAHSQGAGLAKQVSQVKALLPCVKHPKHLVRLVYEHLPAPLTALARFPAWLYSVRRHLPPTTTPSPSTGLSHSVRQGSLVTYFPNIDLALAHKGRFRSRYWEDLHEALNTCAPHLTPCSASSQQPETPPSTTPLSGTSATQNPENSAPKPLCQHWLFMYFPSPQCSLPEAVKLRDGFQAAQVQEAEVEATKVEATKVEAAKVEATKVEAAKVEAAKIEAAKTGKTSIGTSIANNTYHFLEEFLPFTRMRHAVARYLRLVLASARVEKQVRTRFHLPGSHMDLWPMLKKNWADSTRGWRCLERCLMNEAFKGYAAWCGLQDWTVFVQENCPWERLLTKAMHEAHPQGGPVYGMQHSTVRPTDFRYFDDPRLLEDPSLRAALPDMWLCNGTGARDALLAVSGPQARPQTLLAQRLRMVEALRYLYLENTSTSTPNTVEQPAQPRCLLLVTSFFADETWEHLNTLAEAARDGVLEGWQVRIKAHPYLPIKERLTMLFPKGQVSAGQIPEEVEQPVGSLLLPGTVVWASNSTTVALEAALRGLPVLVQAADNDVDLCPLQGMQGVALVRSSADVAAALANPVAPNLPPDYLALDHTLPRWKALLGL